jgi:hypothetical protein
VTLLVLLTIWFGPDVLETALHEATGVATFVAVLLPLMAIAHTRPPEHSP